MIVIVSHLSFTTAYSNEKQLMTHHVLRPGLRHNLRDKEKKYSFIHPILNEHLLYTGSVIKTNKISDLEKFTFSNRNR